MLRTSRRRLWDKAAKAFNVGYQISTFSFR
jgi:hypothetical protein